MDSTVARASAYGKGSVPSLPSGNKPLRPPYSSISMESPVSAQDDGSPAKRVCRTNCERSVAAALDLGGQFLCMGEVSVAVLDAGALANPVRFGLLGYRNLFLERCGVAADIDLSEMRALRNRRWPPR